MVNTNFTSMIQTFISNTNNSTGINGSNTPGQNGFVDSAASQTQADLINYMSSATSSGLISVYNDLASYESSLSQGGATSQTIAGVDSYVHELISLMGNSGMASAGPQSVDNVITYATNAPDSSGKPFGFDGQVGLLGATLSAAEATYTSSKNLTNEAAVLNAMNAYTGQLSKDGASSQLISMVKSTVENSF